MFSSNEFELQLLGWQLHNPSKLVPFTPELLSSLFSNPSRQKLSQILQEYFQKYRVPPTPEALHTHLQESSTDITERASLLALSSQVQSLEKPAPFQDCIDTLESFRLRRSVYDLTTITVEDLPRLSGQELVQALASKASSLQAQVLSASSVRRGWTTTSQERAHRYLDAKHHPDKYAGIPWGIKGFDRVTYGIRRGFLCVIFARPGVGKSRLMLNTAYNQARAQFAVLYISLEMPHDLVEALLDSREALVDYNQILWGKLGEEEDQEKYRLALRRIGRRPDILEVVDIPRDCTTSVIENELKLFSGKYGKFPDVIYVDHIGLVSSRRKVRDKWENMGAVVKELHELGRTYDVAIVSAMHQHRIKGDKEIGLENIYGTDEAGQHAELVVLLEQDAVDEARGILHATWKKNRYGPIGTSCDLIVDWATTYIGDAEVHLSPRTYTPPTNISTDPLEACDVPTEPIGVSGAVPD